MPLTIDDLEPSDTALNCIRDGWFVEDCAFTAKLSKTLASAPSASNQEGGESSTWQELYSSDMAVGQRFCIKVEEVLCSGKSKFQDIVVFKSTHYGVCLSLDGCMQATELDECAYQEMIAHIPLFSCHSAPKKVLIIGGGDGGVLREVLKHPSVECVHQCEIDELVVEVSKQHFKHTLATGYSDPRVTMIYADAVQYVLDCQDIHQFDCIICDSSDPIGPAASLFTPAFYSSMHRILSPGGVLTTQGECQWLYLDLIASVLRTCGDIFSCARYAYATVPSYPSGQIGFIVCSKDPHTDGSAPVRQPPLDMDLHYYSPEMHLASFVLPVFAAKALPQKKASS